MKEFLNKLQGKQSIVVFGCGERGRALYRQLKREYSQMELFLCDSSPKLQGNELLGEVVLSPDEAMRDSGHKLFLVSTPRAANEIYQQLLDGGVKPENIVIEVPDELYALWHEERHQQKMTKHKTLRVEINITKHCNLNCKGCDHFAPLSGEDNMSLDSFKKDMQRLRELFGEKLIEIHILGGEPLMHPEIDSFLEVSRSLFPKASILIDTNGTLLKRMPETFWKHCRDWHIQLNVTPYPVAVDYDDLERMAAEKSVEYGYLQKVKPGGSHTLWKCPIDLEGKQDPMDSFLNCGNANRCITLESGRLYTCSIAPNMYIFNQFYGQDAIQLTDQDGIDIYQAKTAEEIFSYLAEPMPVCRFCDIRHRTFDHPWEVSKKDIKEWTL